MRGASLAAALVLALGGSLFAQDEWAEFTSRQDGFRITFRGPPKVQDVTWTSQMGYPLPARVFSVDRGREHYSVTVADYRGIEKLGIARSMSIGFIRPDGTGSNNLLLGLQQLHGTG